MGLADQLDRVIEKLEKISMPQHQRNEILSIARFLKEQALCDVDRRVKQHEIASAAHLFVKRLYEVSIIAALDQPQNFWKNLENFSQRPIQFSIGPASEITNPRDAWTPRELFAHLLLLIEKESPSTERDICRLGLKTLIVEAGKLRAQRQVKRDREVWVTQVHPFLKLRDLLSSLRDDKNLKAKLDYHLTETWIPKGKREPHV